MKYSKTVYFHEYNIEVIYTICAFLNTTGGTLKIINPYIYDNSLKDLVWLEIRKYIFSDLISSIKIGIRNREKYPYINIEVPKYKERCGLSYVLINGEKSVFFRLKNDNLRVSLEDSRYWELVFHHGFPVIESDDSKVKINTLDFSDTKRLRDRNNIDLFFIDDLSSLNVNESIFKYMDLESALLCLENKVEIINGKKKTKKPNIRFVEPSSWDDQYECRFYNAKYFNDPAKTIPIPQSRTPLLYASCFSIKQDNEAAWILYSHGKKGLASRCVEFTLNFQELINQLFANINNCSFYIDLVQYKEKDFIDHLHEPIIKGKKNNNYDYYFTHFSRNHYLALLTLKRNLFDHEQEMRFFIIPNSVTPGVVKTWRDQSGQLSKKPEYYTIDINWAAIIEEVRIDVNCSGYEKSLLQAKLNILKSQRIKELTMQGISYNLNEINSRFTLKDFDPYKDISLATGPLSIITN